jgi:hypothetical protein
MHKVSRQVLTIQDTKEHEQYKGQTADTSYKLTRSSTLVAFMLDCTDIYQQRVVVDQYNKSGYIPNALKIIPYPIFLNVNKSFFFWMKTNVNKLRLNHNPDEIPHIAHGDIKQK